MRRHAKRSTKATISTIAALCVALTMCASASAAPKFTDTTFACTPTAKCGSFESMTPERAAVNEATGDVYVIDTAPAKGAIQVFDKDGAYKETITLPADKGKEEGSEKGFFGFNTLHDDIAIDNSFDGNGDPTATQGRIYVAAGLSKLFAFEADGSFDWEGDTANGCGIAVDTGGEVFKAEHGGGVRQVKADDGTTVGSPIVAPGDIGDSCNLAFDSADNLYVLRLDSASVEKLSASNSYAVPGTTLAVVGSATDVEVDRSTDRSYVPGSGLMINFFSADGTADPASPVFSDVTERRYMGLAVNSKADRLYVVAEGSKNVEIWDLLVGLEVSKTGSGTGTVQCDTGTGPGACQAEYPEGTGVELIATPDPGSGFSGFTVLGSTAGCGKASTCKFALTSKTEVFAKFEKLNELTVAKTGTGAGKVTSSPAGIDCGSICKASFLASAEVTLSASPGAGSTFTGWSGACSGTGACKVKMNQARSVTAGFAPIPTGGGGNTGGGNGNSGGGGTDTTPPPPPPPPPPVDKLGPCIATANKAAQKAKKAAKKKQGKAKAKAIKAANKRKAQAIKACKARFA